MIPIESLATVTQDKNLKVLFNKTFALTDARMQNALSIPLKVDKLVTPLGWLGSAGTVNEWLDQKKIQSLNQYDYSITVKEWENTVGVKIDDIRRDGQGIIVPRIREISGRMKIHPEALLSALLIAGTSGLAYDGKAFFANDHESGLSGAQDNLLAGALGSTTIGTARKFFKKVKDDNGEPMGLPLTHIVVPSELEETALKLARSPYDPSGATMATNIYQGEFEVIVDYRLSDVDDWYAFSISPGIAPFIYGWEIAPHMTQLGSLTRSPETTESFFHKKVYYSAEGNYNFQYGKWQTAVKFVN